MNYISLAILGVLVAFSTVCMIIIILSLLPYANAVPIPIREHISNPDYRCMVSPILDITLFNYTDTAGHNITISCKYMKDTDDFRFIGYYDSWLKIGECQFERGTNHWQMNLVNGTIASTNWTSTSSNGTITMQWFTNYQS